MYSLLKNKKGSAMEMAIFYVLVIVLLGTLICMASVYALSSVRNNEVIFENIVDRKVELDLVGDIFLNGIVNRDEESYIITQITNQLTGPNSKNKLDCTVEMYGYSNYDTIKKDSTVAVAASKIEKAMSKTEYTPKMFVGRVAKWLVDSIIGPNKTVDSVSPNDVAVYAEAMSSMYNIYEMRILDNNNNLLMDVAIKESFIVPDSDQFTVQNISLEATYEILNWSDQLLNEQKTQGTTQTSVDKAFNGDASIVTKQGSSGSFSQIFQFLRYTSAAIAANIAGRS